MKYWLILMKDKERKLTCFPNPLLCRGAVEFLGSGVFIPLHILHCILCSKIFKNKPQRSSIGVWYKFADVGGGGGGGGLPPFSVFVVSPPGGKKNFFTLFKTPLKLC